MSETLRINRAEHLTGAVMAATGIDSGLFHYCHDTDNAGLYCCLGLYCRDLKSIFSGDMNQTSFPTDLGGFQGYWGAFSPEQADIALVQAAIGREIGCASTQKVEQLIGIVNDEKPLLPSKREELLTYLFKKYGDIDLEFYGAAADAIALAKGDEE